jgi:hypothetical protein
MLISAVAEKIYILPAMKKPPLTHILTSICYFFLVTATLTGVRWNPIVSLICISLMDKHVKHFIFRHLLAICTCFFEKCSIPLLIY